MAKEPISTAGGSATTRLVVHNNETIRAFLLVAAADEQRLSGELRDIASDLSSQSSVPYRSLRSVWSALPVGARPSLTALFSGAEFLFSSPKPREKSEELKERLRKLAEMAERKEYEELVKDVAPRMEKAEPFSSYKDQIGFADVPWLPISLDGWFKYLALLSSCLIRQVLDWLYCVCVGLDLLEFYWYYGGFVITGCCTTSHIFLFYGMGWLGFPSGCGHYVSLTGYFGDYSVWASYKWSLTRVDWLLIMDSGGYLLIVVLFRIYLVLMLDGLVMRMVDWSLLRFFGLLLLFWELALEHHRMYVDHFKSNAAAVPYGAPLLGQRCTTNDWHDHGEGAIICS
ncbi:hypothetical protein MA16_Dca020586 [Dendrobium catenatum]|uniref:Uncharacterized protein n=1 Tax=Dendrobium catenatum TaxID=906689 RepID=A0A2I0VFI0_9ASPA|nr:hypothetical protein MA16_Dca020586 [Dendrobium catenatum]